ncbi:hypothetical protein SAMN05880573_10958 [Chryseobacterium sp. RU33C]|nr:hypothetical protein SAMN05880573_10958 [Chryseobacterium sp. RU33C]
MTNEYVYHNNALLPQAPPKKYVWVLGGPYQNEGKTIQTGSQ